MQPTPYLSAAAEHFAAAIGYQDTRRRQIYSGRSRCLTQRATLGRLIQSPARCAVVAIPVHIAPVGKPDGTCVMERREEPVSFHPCFMARQ